MAVSHIGLYKCAVSMKGLRPLFLVGHLQKMGEPSAENHSETVEDVPLDMADMGLSMSVKYIVPAWWLQSIKIYQ